MFSEIQKNRIEHIRSHIEGDFAVMSRQRAANNVRLGTGSVPNSLGSLESYALAKGMYAWFALGDIHEFKRWMFLGAKARQGALNVRSDTINAGAKMFALLLPLLSGNLELIDWFSKKIDAFDKARIEDSRTHDFWAFQAITAMQRDMSTLRGRCERLRAHPPRSSAEKKYAGDHDFYEGLANGDVDRMCGAIAKIVSPASMKSRSSDESGYTENLISTSAVIYSKLAELNGFNLDVDSQYVPSAWFGDGHYSTESADVDFLSNFL